MYKEKFIFNCNDKEAPNVYHKYNGQECTLEKFIENGHYLVRFDDNTTLDALDEELTPKYVDYKSDPNYNPEEEE